MRTETACRMSCLLKRQGDFHTSLKEHPFACRGVYALLWFNCAAAMLSFGPPYVLHSIPYILYDGVLVRNRHSLPNTRHPALDTLHP